MTKVTQFPAMVFPVLFEGGEHRAKRIPVSDWAQIEAVERMATFTGWAGDPRTGVVNIKIEQADLEQVVKEWVAGMGPVHL